MGNINLTVKAGELNELVNLDTPYDDASKDKPILEALQKVGDVKDRGYAAVIEQLNADHDARLNEINEAHKAELKSLREPIEAGIISARMRQIKDLNVEEEKEYWAGVPLDQLLRERKYWVGQDTAETDTPKTSGDVPKQLASQDDEMI